MFIFFAQLLKKPLRDGCGGALKAKNLCCSITCIAHYGAHFDLFLLAFFERFDIFEAGFELRLDALGRGAVVLFARKRVGQALHIRKLVLEVVRVLITLAVIKFFHKFCRRVAYDKRHRLGKRIQSVALCRLVRGVKRI